ncbi:MAG: AAA family ATPase [Planctomycetes bacterium]|nr:AAA family ATPase [Planctomycetota bacterium]
MPADNLQPLRDAMALTPRNLPLRLHLVDSLLGVGRNDEAAAVAKEGLALAPGEVGLKLALARVYLNQGKYAAGVVVCEDVLRTEQTAAVYLLLAKLLHREGSVDRAVAMYRAGIDADPDQADASFEAALGINAADSNDVIDGKVRMFTDTNAAEVAGVSEIERPKTKFADVGGMDTMKEAIQLKIIHPLKHAELFKAYGQKAGGGLLMYGPPGCGKTHLARATAGEVQAGFIAVGLHDILDMWMGNTEKNLHALFEQARHNQPCVLFFDEVDALAASRTDFRTSTMRHAINQFLSEMDGVNTSNEGVLILAATNAPWHLDSAFRRPGRFDKILFVPPPDAAARAVIVRLCTHGKPQVDLDCAAVAAGTDGFSGADIKALVERAVEEKLKDAMRTGVPKPLSTRDLLAAAQAMKPSTREWFADARNYAMYANEGGQYDELVKYMKLR